ncbi:(d)CMP kinase [Moraxella sp. FZLJ2107]|uniref:(d)CMP kinase n=1 Tax=unclassified Moraxella TaxID=2685852 RepID=UPI00209BE06D|nr:MULTISPECIES: (d)CMP kinase [unclassified Moraxella]USZ14566.1 (d)CMP kinase [Moraxella sp. FZFQ2102]UTO05238.1 (d)CMP kinase [Moraxella sp. FZLJ2107]UTO21973.1 (d)CMP kinase [Moraxella sp. FZLJ2109]
MTNQTHTVICIDGPSGAGKGTLAYRLADELGYNLLDSGALYRIVGLLAHQAGLLVDGVADLEVQLEKLTQSLNLAFVINHDTKAVEIVINGKPLQDDIRNETVGSYASKVAVFPKVRAALLDVQRNMAAQNGVIADGRDMGTVVFPDAPVKVFLTASAAARADRRVAQLKQAGKAADYDAILNDIKARDERDENRSVAPSKPADDALVLDSSELDASQVYARVRAFCEQKGVVFTN